jgi:hypothetical protein
MKKFSFLYATKGRPEVCFDQVHRWISEAEKSIPKSSFEIVVCIADADADAYAKTLNAFKNSSCVRFIFNKRKKIDYYALDFTGFDAREYLTSVTSWNDCAAVAYGEWLVCIADDLFPCDSFIDDLFDSINKVEKDFGAGNCYLLAYHDEAKNGYVKHPVLNKNLYRAQGYVFHPAYIHEYADADLWMESQLNYAIKPMIEANRPMVTHNNPMFNHAVSWDSTYSSAHNAKASEYCKRVFERRVKDAVAKYSSPIFLDRTENKIDVKPEDQSDIMSFVDDILSKVATSTTSIMISQPKRRDEDVPIQSFVTSDHVRHHFGMTTKYASVHSKMADEARNILINNAINMNAKYLIFIDDDVALPRDGIGMLVQTAERLGGSAVVGGVCALKGSSMPAISSIDSEGRLYTPDCKPSFEPLEINWTTGAACLLIPVSILRKMKEDHPKMPFCWFAKKDGKQVIGEDVFLCQRILKAGFKIFIDRRVQCLHFDMPKKEYYSYMPVDENQYSTIFGKNIKRVE